ncbi:muramoyltetrapeptide carboxypeptidase [Caloramator fervidus]|uniref:Muramoyltetrapeptide carboxypeptidase n=1 Tax=Caloramator fervidus TaxID=29344 RepID=A0A1H5SA31_9CLOT|nr:LD-carboxypeptidase [Caloramator fervidus]SEF47486.1 muramoyltetrapeptide carboxypeptidase [Caloramator fervidus]
MKPTALKKGDKIGIIAPSSPVLNFEKFNKSVKLLESYGYKVILGKSCFLKHGFLAGEDDVRAKDLNDFFSMKDVKAIFCLRGGYGSIRILDKIDFDIIDKNPKIFVGYSDITALLNIFFDKLKLVVFHGPMVGTGEILDEFNFNSLLNCLTGKLTNLKVNLRPINRGDIEGVIVGGNLSVLNSIIGTRYNIDLKDKILFIEEINEEPYKIDRMLYTLKYMGVFDRLKGVILGQFVGCDSKDKEFNLEYVLNEFFSSVKVPVYYGLQVGHAERKITIPIGIKVKIFNDQLVFLEEGVIND